MKNSMKLSLELKELILFKLFMKLSKKVSLGTVKDEIKLLELSQVLNNSCRVNKTLIQSYVLPHPFKAYLKVRKYILPKK